MLLITHRLLFFSFICSLAVCSDIAYEVSGASFSPVNCKFVCLSAVECYSLNGNYKLASSFVIIAGVVQKRWFIGNTSSANSEYLYGAIELNSNPWQLKDWKWIGGSKETHAFEPNMKIKILSSDFTYKNATIDKLEEDKQRFDLADHMWLLLAAKDMSTSLSAKQDLHDELKTFEKTAQFHGANKSHNESEHSSTYEYLLQLSYCDYWAHSRAVDLAAECYQCTLLSVPCKSSTFEKLSWSEMFPLFRAPPSVQVLSLDVRKSPLLCSDLRNTDSDNNGVGDSLLCHWLFGSFRMAAHSLVQSIDSQRALEVVETVMELMGEQPQWADSNVFRIFSSLRVISRRLLGQFEPPASTTYVASARSHSDLCQWVVRHSVAHSDSEAVHNLFQKLCFQLEREAVISLPAAANYREITSQAQSLVSSLLGIGAVEVAAVVVANTVSALCLPPSAAQPALLDLSSVLADLMASYPVLQRYVSSNATDNNLEDVLHSGNVRAAFTLYRVFTTVLLRKEEEEKNAFLADSDLLTTFLNTLLQAASPVVLDLGHGHDELSAECSQEHRSEVLMSGGWAAEAVVLRATLVSILDTLLHICSQRLAYQHGGSGSNVDVPLCRVNDPVGGIGGRGLFLLAYQGLNLLVPPEECSVADKSAVDGSGSDLLCDWAVPRRYHDLMQVLNPTVEVLNFDHSRLQQHSSVQSRPLRPKIAFLSFHLTRHSVGRLLAKVIAGIDTAHFDVHIITKQQSPRHSSTSQNDDDVHAFLHSVIPPSRWVFIPLSAEAAVETIRSEGFDAVIYGDVFMDSCVAHLAMSRLAPVQVCFWGHPFTTGYSSMDYFVTSDSFEPADAIQSRANQFSEQLVRFDSLSFQMFPAEQPADGGVGPSDISVKNDVLVSSFAVSRLRYLEWVLPISLNVHNMDVDVAELREHFTVLTPPSHSTQSLPPVSSSSTLSLVAAQVRLYSALQSLFKMHPLFDQAILQILRDDPRAIILLSRNAKQAVWQNRLSRRLTRTAAQQNDTALLSRLWFVNQMPHAEYARLLCGVEVSLDTFPFGGGVTLCDAVTGCSNPVPFVTSGELQSVHHIGAGLAAKFNHSGVAVSTPPLSSQSHALTMDEKIRDYVSAAIELASRSQHDKLMGVAGDDIYSVTVSASGSESLPDEHRHHTAPITSSRMSDIQYAVHDDPQSADEWNRFLRKIT